MMVMAVTVLLCCFVQGSDWKVPEGWRVESISNRDRSAEVKLSRVIDGDSITVEVPVGCDTQPPPESSGIGNLRFNSVPNAVIEPGGR